MLNLLTEKFTGHESFIKEMAQVIDSSPVCFMISNVGQILMSQFMCPAGDVHMISYNIAMAAH
jgi:hypothetical protein